MNNDPYGHLFFNCQHTINFINHDKLKYFIYKNCNGNKNWSLTKNQTIKLFTLIYKPQTNNKAFKPDPTININFHFAENAQYKKYRLEYSRTLSNFNQYSIKNNLTKTQKETQWSETIKKFKKEWSINTNEPIPTITPPINY
ncbi:hypothetical protein ACTFIT_001498 [Dictyostelium discoideum]